MRRAAKVDDNQEAIVAALRAAGATAQSLAQVGKGVPDLLVGYRRQSFLLEVKDPAQPPSKRALTADQQVWHRSWNGFPVAIVQTPDDALAAIGAIQAPAQATKPPPGGSEEVPAPKSRQNPRGTCSTAIPKSGQVPK